MLEEKNKEALRGASKLPVSKSLYSLQLCCYLTAKCKPRSYMRPWLFHLRIVVGHWKPRSEWSEWKRQQEVWKVIHRDRRSFQERKDAEKKWRRLKGRIWHCLGKCEEGYCRKGDGRSRQWVKLWMLPLLLQQILRRAVTCKSMGKFMPTCCNSCFPSYTKILWAIPNNLSESLSRIWIQRYQTLLQTALCAPYQTTLVKVLWGSADAETKPSSSRLSKPQLPSHANHVPSTSNKWVSAGGSPPHGEGKNISTLGSPHPHCFLRDIFSSTLGGAKYQWLNFFFLSHVSAGYATF